MQKSAPIRSQSLSSSRARAVRLAARPRTQISCWRQGQLTIYAKLLILAARFSPNLERVFRGGPITLQIIWIGWPTLSARRRSKIKASLTKLLIPRRDAKTSHGRVEHRLQMGREATSILLKSVCGWCGPRGDQAPALLMNRQPKRRAASTRS